MPPRGTNPDIVRIVEGLAGQVEMRTELVMRFDYGSIVPWVRRLDDGALLGIGRPDALVLRTPVELAPEEMTHVAEFTVRRGDRVPFTLTWFSSADEPPRAIDPEHALAQTDSFWRDWVGKCGYEGEYPDAVHTSLLVLKALTYAPTGAIVAAPTTSLPERIGGVRNWDYRFAWVRDTAFTLDALINLDLRVQVHASFAWLLDAVERTEPDLHVFYDLDGETVDDERELDLAGYRGSRPVLRGNGAAGQLQLSCYGDLLETAELYVRDGNALDD